MGALAALGAVVVQQDGFLDASQFIKQCVGGDRVSGLRGGAGHEVDDLQSQDAGEGMDADVVIGPVMHGREGDYVEVLELSKRVPEVGLGAVGGHDLG